MHDMLQYQKVGFCNPTAQQQIVTLGLEGRYFPGRGIKEINESEWKILNSWKCFPKGFRSYTASLNLFLWAIMQPDVLWKSLA